MLEQPVKYPYVGENPLGFVFDILDDLETLFAAHNLKGRLFVHSCKEGEGFRVIIDWQSEQFGKCQYDLGMQLKPLYLFGSNLNVLRKDVLDSFTRKIEGKLG